MVAVLAAHFLSKLLMETAIFLLSVVQTSETAVACRMAFSATAWLVKQTLGIIVMSTVTVGGALSVKVGTVTSSWQSSCTKELAMKKLAAST
jgi:hypothetical protein